MSVSQIRIIWFICGYRKKYFRIKYVNFSATMVVLVLFESCFDLFETCRWLSDRRPGALLAGCLEVSQRRKSETVAANGVAAINPQIDDTDPIRKFSIDPGIHTNLRNPAQFSPKGKPIRNFSIEPASSIRTSIADAIFADAISETSIRGEEKRKHISWRGGL